MKSKTHNHSIIAISGLKNSGKDTAAEMLLYLMNSPKCLHSYWCFKKLKTLFKKNTWECRSFAYPLKQMLAVLLGVPVERFNDRTFKEDYCVNFRTFKINPTYKVNSQFLLSDNKFTKACRSVEPFAESYNLTIRQLMQYFGTNIMRMYFGDDLWVLATLKSNKNLIISDLRFKVEADAVKNHCGKIIYINRDGAVPGNHASEREVVELLSEGKIDFQIDNNGSLKELFNSLKNITKQLK